MKQGFKIVCYSPSNPLRFLTRLLAKCVEVPSSSRKYVHIELSSSECHVFPYIGIFQNSLGLVTNYSPSLHLCHVLHS